MPNQLAAETSPYLQQHADNPVDWHPWGEEALRLAREQDKPILLSVGYSACHWCHVMAHESFEDPQIAATMNRLFVNIKVDREERPDLDQIYQTAHHMLTQRAGGWPLTMFLTPAQKPFFGGTYFPKSPRYGLPGFGSLLEQVAQVYRSKRAEIDQQNESLLEFMNRTLPAPPGEVALERGADSRCGRGSARELRRSAWGSGRRAEISASLRTRFLLAGGRFDRRYAAARTGAAYARENGAGRNLRPARRRFLPLQRGSVLADPAFRENALRQRAVAEAVHRRLADHRQSACSRVFARKPRRG